MHARAAFLVVYEIAIWVQQGAFNCFDGDALMGTGTGL